MGIFLRYVKSGVGIGARWLAIYALIIAVISGIGAKIIGNDSVPTLQSVTDELFPIKIENGAIVEPVDVVKAVKFDVEGNIIPIILDTRVDTINVVGLKNGIYISRKAVYWVSDGQSRVRDFEKIKEPLFLDRIDYTEFFKKMASYVAVIMGCFVFVSLLVIYLALTAFYAVIAQVIAKISKVTLNYAAAMRLSAVAYVVTSLLMTLLRYAGLTTPLTLYVIAIVLLQVVTIRLLSNLKEENKE